MSNYRHNGREREHAGRCPLSSGTVNRVAAPPRPLLLTLAYAVVTVYGLLSPASSFAAITLTEASIRAALVVDARKPNADGFLLRSDFQVGATDTLNPATETVVFKVGPFSQSFPADSFKQTGNQTRTTWTFRGPRTGLKEMVITRAGQAWTVTARAKNVNLSATANPITIQLQIGDDSGSRSLFFVVDEKGRRKVFKCNRSERESEIVVVAG